MESTPTTQVTTSTAANDTSSLPDRRRLLNHCMEEDLQQIFLNDWGWNDWISGRRGLLERAFARVGRDRAQVVADEAVDVEQHHHAIGHWHEPEDVLRGGS